LEERFLRREVSVEEAFGDLGLLGDVVHAGSGEPEASECSRGGAHQQHAPLSRLESISLAGPAAGLGRGGLRGCHHDPVILTD
jgi:hypothetical protein